MKRLPLLGAAALGLLSVCAPAFADGYRSSRYGDRHDHDRGSWRHHDDRGHARYDGRHDRGRHDGRYDGRHEREARHAFRVLYRSSCGTRPWREHGCYDCRESAERVARHLSRDGYHTRVECG